MAWDFLKKRWFTIALLLLLLVAIVRRNTPLDKPDTVEPVRQVTPRQELYTDDATSSKSASMLNLGSSDTPERIQLPEIGENTAVAFLQRFGRVAVAEQQKFGMPASVLLACAYVNSFSGRRACAVQANNYLAVPCTKGWNGPTASFDGRCFRQYTTAWESIRGFSLYLQGSEWFVDLKNSAGLDWKPWVKGLARHRVSDVQDFEREMVKVIEDYRLFELDALSN